ncbi:hypothetical protein BV898_19318 [Hypsibius exemplaris]|uniref:G-protein coupled receptors family 1 profile domain-containing protein n=1 Tax=Hypsibius exemplaris TaxID=2072580 RepID=A0A9X6NLG4_HYPEX|nr:hypothetical protein BV898_19318 [Hypsibius exemplaris]
MASNGTHLLSNQLYCAFTLPPISNTSWNNTSLGTNVSVNQLGVTAWIYCTSVLCVVGATLNLFVLILITKYSVLRTGVGHLIAHLLLCQMIMCAAIIPVSVHRITTVPKDLNLIYCRECKEKHPFQVIFTAIINWNEGILSLNRLLGGIAPIYYHNLNSRRMQYGSLLLPWSLVLLFAVPPAFDVWGVYLMSGIGACTLVPRHVVSVTLFVLNGYVSIVLTFVAAVGIIARFQFTAHHKKRTVEATNNAAALAPAVGPRVTPPFVASNWFSERQKRVSKMLVATSVSSICCQLPHYAFLLAGLAPKYSLTMGYLTALAYVHFTATPVRLPDV